MYIYIYTYNYVLFTFLCVHIYIYIYTCISDVCEWLHESHWNSAAQVIAQFLPFLQSQVPAGAEDEQPIFLHLGELPTTSGANFGGFLFDLGFFGPGSCRMGSVENVVHMCPWSIKIWGDGHPTVGILGIWGIHGQIMDGSRNVGHVPKL